MHVALLLHVERHSAPIALRDLTRRRNRTMTTQDARNPRSPAPWLRLALIETAVAATGALALLALVAVVDERVRALMPFIPH